MADFVFDSDYPLDRVPGESLKANQALRDYALMGPGRSLRGLVQMYRNQTDTHVKTDTGRVIALRMPDGAIGRVPPTRRWASISDWNRRYAWRARIDVWEKHLLAEEEYRWMERRKQEREEEWSKRTSLYQLVDAILAEGPKFIRTTRRVVGDREIVTLALDGYMAIRAMEVAAKLGRLATGMDTEYTRHEHSGPGGGPIPVAAFEMDLSHMDDEQLRAALGSLGNIAKALADGADLYTDSTGAAESHPDHETPGETLS